MPSTTEVTTPSDREIRVTRTFDAPVELVFDAHTKPDLVKRWLLGPDGWSMPVCEIDLRVGGRYHYLWHNDADGREFGVQGEFHEIAAPNRLVHSERMDGFPGQAFVTTTFDAAGAQTRFSITIRFESQELRDGALESGMTGGMETSYNRLQEFINAKQIA
jgi:uncharacterized protein YndB with AHSA1/START domain